MIVIFMVVLAYPFGVLVYKCNEHIIIWITASPLKKFWNRNYPDKKFIHCDYNMEQALLSRPATQWL